MKTEPNRRPPFTRLPRLRSPHWPLLVLALGTASCNLAPRYAPPALAVPKAFKESPSADAAGTWQPAAPADAGARGPWWSVYADATLGALEERVQVSNQSIQAAAANFRVSRALAVQARASLFPTAAATGSFTRQRQSQTYSTSGGGTPPNGVPFNQYDLPVDATYTVDLWGRVRNTVAAGVYSAQASAGDLAAATLSTQAELAADYFALRAVDEQRRIYKDTVAAYEQTLDLTRTLVRSGIDSDEDLATAQTQLDTVVAQATDLGVARAQYEHALAVLVGEAPAAFSLAPAPFDPRIPAVPAAVPSELLQRRPDIAAAERRVAAANAEVGVARTAYFPNLALSGDLGFEATQAARWFEWPSRIWSVGPQLSGTVFDVGGLRGVNEQAQAEYDQAVATYRQTVLTAFQSVEDNLAALMVLTRESAQQQTAVASAEHTLALSLTRFRAGIDSALNVETAQNTVLANRQSALQVRLRQVQASLALVVALGGGWDASASPSRKDVFAREPHWTPAGAAPAPSPAPRPAGAATAPGL